MESMQLPQENTPQPQVVEAPKVTSQVPDLAHMSLGELAEIEPDALREMGAYALAHLRKPVHTIAGSSGS